MCANMGECPAGAPLLVGQGEDVFRDPGRPVSRLGKGMDGEEELTVLFLEIEFRDAALRMPGQGFVSEPSFLLFLEKCAHPDGEF